MLCPSCGASVGDDIRLCDKCQAERGSEQPKKAQEPPPVEESVSESVEEITVEETASSATSGMLMRVVALVVSGLSLAVFGYVIVMKTRGRAVPTFVEQERARSAPVVSAPAVQPAETSLQDSVATTEPQPSALEAESAPEAPGAAPQADTVDEAPKAPMKFPDEAWERAFRGEKEEDPTLRRLQEIEQRLTAEGASPAGYAQSGQLRLLFEDQIAFYYPRYFRIDVGFYADALSADERAQIVRAGSITVSGKERRPNALLSLPLNEGPKGINPENLFGYSIQFYRDFGRFDFPGFTPFVEFSRRPERVISGEVPRLTGELKPEAKLQGIVIGFGDDRSTRTSFEWGFKIDTPLNFVK